MRNPVVLLERVWRNTVVYPLLRTVIHNPPIPLPIDLAQIDSVLILRYDKIGDMIVTLPILRMLKRRNPGLRLGVLSSEDNVEIIRGNQNIDDLYVVRRNPFRLFGELRRIRKAHYRIVMNFIFNRMTTGGLISNFVCRDAIKIGLGPEKYRFYFNVLLSIPRGTIHMLEMLASYVESVFGVEVAEEEKRMGLDVDSSAVARVDDFLQAQGLTRRIWRSKNATPFVVFNISARQENKRLSIEQSTRIAVYLGEELQRKTVVVCAPEDRSVAEQVVSEAKSQNCILFPERGQASLKEIASLVAGAMFIVTPDTAIVHIASAVSTAVLGIFTPLQVNEEWLPYKVRYELIKASEDKPVSSIPLQTIVNGIKRFSDQLTVDTLN